MINVRLEDGSVRSFPDGTSEADMLKALAPAPAAPPPPAPEAPGIGAGMQFLTQFGQAAATAPWNALSYLTSFLPPNQDRWSIRNMADVTAREFQGMYDPLVAEPKGTTEKVASLLGNALGSMTGPLAVAPAGVPGFLASTFLPTAGQERLQALDLGASEAQAKAQGAVSGGLETLTELFMGKIGNVVAPMKLAGVKPVDMLTEGLGEAAQSLGADLSAAYLTQTDPSRAQGMGGRAAESFAAGVLGAAAFAPVQRAVVNEQRSMLRDEVKDLTAQLRANPEDQEIRSKLIASQTALQSVIAEDAPRDPAKLAKKIGLENVEFSTEVRPGFVPLTENPDGTLSGYGATVTREGILTGDPTEPDLFKQAAVYAGLTQIGDEDISQVKPSFITAQANIGTGKVAVNPSGLTEDELVSELREEKTHLLINRTPEGQAILDTFWKTRQLTEDERAALDLYKKRAGETDPAFEKRLADEFLAKLERPGWLRKRSAEFVAQVKDTLGMELTNAQAGRLLLRNLRRVPVPASGPVPVQAVPQEIREALSDFDQSQVRNPDGSLKVLYHGTADKKALQTGISVFTADRREVGPHFGSVDQATQFTRDPDLTRHGQMYPVYLNIRNPLRTIDMWPLGAIPFSMRWQRSDELRELVKDGKALEVLEEALEGLHTGESLRNALEKLGYDGIVYDNRSEGGGDSWIAFRPEQIKSAIGNKGTFDVTNPDIRESLSDTEYLTAVQAGDMGKAQKMVDEAAKRAGYRQKGYHGTGADFTTFKVSRTGNFGPGVYVTFDPEDARAYANRLGGSKVLSVFVRATNPVRIKNANRASEEFFDRFPGATDEESVAKAKAAGHDAVWAVEDVSTRYGVNKAQISVFSPEQVKSADPVTYDDAGNVIPLSKRFNAASQDIRESLTQYDLNELTRDIPGTKLVLGPNPGKITEQDDGSFLVDPSVPKSRLRSYVTLAEAEKGIFELPVDFIQRYIDRVDPTHSGDPRQWLASRFRKHHERGLLKYLFDQLRLLLPGEKIRAERAFSRLLDTIASEPGEFKTKYTAADSAQALANAHGPVLEQIRAVIYPLRVRASKREELALWNDWKHKLEQDLTRLRDEFRAPIRVASDQADAEGNALPSITHEDFLPHIGQDTPENRRDQNSLQYIRAVEQYINLLEQLDQLNARYETLSQFGLGEGTASEIQSTQERMTRLREKMESFPDFDAAVVEHRALLDAQVDARAAQSALANNPILSAWADVVSATEVPDENGGFRELAPDPTSIPESTLNNAKIEYYFSRQKIQDEAEETQVSLGDRVRKKLAELKKALKAKGIQKADKDIAAAEIIEAAAGLPDRSGRVEPREIVQQIVILKNQAILLATRMAQNGLAADSVTDWQQNPERLKQLSEQLGFTQDVLRELLQLLDRSPSFKNAVMTVRDRAEAQVRNDPLVIIQRIEDAPEEDRPKILRPALRRLRNSSLRLSGEVNRIEKEIEGLEQELADLQAIYTLFGEPDENILTELRAGRDVTALRNQRDANQDSATAVERVVYQSEHGWVFRGFLGEPDLVIGPSQPFTKSLLAKVRTWREQAQNARDSVPGYVQRGIDIGDRIAQMFLNENFTTEELHKALMPTGLLESFARSPFGWKGLLPALVPGLYGGLLQDRLRNVADATSAKNGVEARYIQPMYEAVTRAMDSLGLSRRKLNDVLLFQKIRNEVSHRLRSFGSGVEDGQELWSAPGYQITVEMLALVRLDAKLGRDARAIDARRPYAGIRLGERIVRPSGETGDVGLARLADRDILERLVEAYKGSEETKRAWWSTPAAQNALRFHVFDADRNDNLIKRDPATRTKEIELKRRMTPTMLRDLVTVEDWASAIGITVDQLMAELGQYHEIAKARLSEPSTDPITQTGMFSSISDKTEFTSPAAKLAFPSSWYDYGSSTGLKGFLNRTVDTANVEFVQTLKEAEDNLRQIENRIETNQLDVGEMQWLLGTTRTEFTESDRNKALASVRSKKNFVRVQRDAVKASRARPAMDRGIRLMHRFGIAPTLATLSAMVQNIAGAGVSSYLTLAPTMGPVAAALLTPFMIGGAVLHAAMDVLHTTSIAVAPVPESDANAWLLEQGLGVSYMKQFEAEREAVERGQVAGNRLGAGWDEGVRRLSGLLGTVRGDQINNRFAVRVLVPLTILALKFKGANTPESREFLTGLGLGTPEEAAQAIAELPLLGFWRTDAGAALARAIVREYNAPSTANRPEGGGYFSLLGWTAFTFGSMIKQFRRTPDQSRLRYLKPLVAGVTVAIASDIARTVALDQSKTFIRYVAETLLRVLPEDDDDEEGWFESLVTVLGIYRLLHATEAVAATPPKLQPWDKSWREQDPLTIAVDLAKRAGGGMGINEFSLPIWSIGSNALSGIFQMGRGVLDTGATDIKAGARKAFGLAGFYGRVVGETLIPGGRPGYEANADIVAAAQASGIPVTARPFQSSFMSSTPFRREMLDIGFRLLQNDPAAEADLAKLRERIETRARTRAAKTGADQDDAAEAAINSMVVSLDPYRNAIGRSLSKEEYEKLRALAGPKAERVSRARDAIVKALKIRVTPAMKSPLRKQRGVGKPKRVRL